MNKRIMAVFGLIVLVGLSGCVATGGGNNRGNLQTRLYRQEQQLQQLMSQFDQVEQVRPGQAEMWSQLQTMRQEINILNGKIDDLQGSGGGRELGRLREKVARLEAVVRQMASQLAINVDSLDMSDAGAYGSPYAPGGQSSVQPYGSAAGYDPAAQTNPQYPISPGATQPGGVVSTSPSASVRQPDAASSTAQTGATGAKDTAGTPYEIGIKAVDQRRYQDAVVACKDFPASFPKHNLARPAHLQQGA